MFQRFQKNHQSQYLAKTWQQTLRKREITKNNYHATGDIKKAKAFVTMISNFTFQTNTRDSEHVIFSSDAIAVPLRPAYVFAAF